MTDVPVTEPKSMTYLGNELDLFALAGHWKSYYRGQLVPYIHGRVLEVGAGIGGTTALLAALEHEQWVALEPDLSLAQRLGKACADGSPAADCRVVCGTIDSVASRSFDCVLYIDVLEHIEDDHGELARARQCLIPGGLLIVLSPAHQWLFSPFDRAIGHYRRYDRRTLASAASGLGLRPVLMRYLDSVGLLASAANRWWLSQPMPSQSQILTWDRWLVRASRRVDGCLGYRLGKSILGIWEAV